MPSAIERARAILEEARKRERESRTGIVPTPYEEWKRKFLGLDDEDEEVPSPREMGVPLSPAQRRDRRISEIIKAKMEAKRKRAEQRRQEISEPPVKAPPDYAFQMEEIYEPPDLTPPAEEFPGHPTQRERITEAVEARDVEVPQHLFEEAPTGPVAEPSAPEAITKDTEPPIPGVITKDTEPTEKEIPKPPSKRKEIAEAVEARDVEVPQHLFEEAPTPPEVEQVFPEASAEIPEPPEEPPDMGGFTPTDYTMLAAQLTPLPESWFKDIASWAKNLGRGEKPVDVLTSKPEPEITNYAEAATVPEVEQISPEVAAMPSDIEEGDHSFIDGTNKAIATTVLMGVDPEYREAAFAGVVDSMAGYADQFLGQIASIVDWAQEKPLSVTAGIPILGPLSAVLKGGAATEKLVEGVPLKKARDHVWSVSDAYHKVRDFGKLNVYGKVSDWIEGQKSEAESDEYKKLAMDFGHSLGTVGFFMVGGKLYGGTKVAAALGRAGSSLFRSARFLNKFKGGKYAMEKFIDPMLTKVLPRTGSDVQVLGAMGIEPETIANGDLPKAFQQWLGGAKMGLAFGGSAAPAEIGRRLLGPVSLSRLGKRLLLPAVRMSTLGGVMYKIERDGGATPAEAVMRSIPFVALAGVHTSKDWDTQKQVLRELVRRHNDKTGSNADVNMFDSVVDANREAVETGSEKSKAKAEAVSKEIAQNPTAQNIFQELGDNVADMTVAKAIAPQVPGETVESYIDMTMLRENAIPAAISDLKKRLRKTKEGSAKNKEYTDLVNRINEANQNNDFQGLKSAIDDYRKVAGKKGKPKPWSAFGILVKPSPEGTSDPSRNVEYGLYADIAAKLKLPNPLEFSDLKSYEDALPRGLTKDQTTVARHYYRVSHKKAAAEAEKAIESVDIQEREEGISGEEAEKKRKPLREKKEEHTKRSKAKTKTEQETPEETKALDNTESVVYRIVQRTVDRGDAQGWREQVDEILDKEWNGRIGPELVNVARRFASQLADPSDADMYNLAVEYIKALGSRRYADKAGGEIKETEIKPISEPKTAPAPEEAKPPKEAATEKEVAAREKPQKISVPKFRKTNDAVAFVKDNGLLESKNSEVEATLQSKRDKALEQAEKVEKGSEEWSSLITEAQAYREAKELISGEYRKYTDDQGNILVPSELKEEFSAIEAKEKAVLEEPIEAGGKSVSEKLIRPEDARPTISFQKANGDANTPAWIWPESTDPKVVDYVNQHRTQVENAVLDGRYERWIESQPTDASKLEVANEVKRILDSFGIGEDYYKEAVSEKYRNLQARYSSIFGQPESRRSIADTSGRHDVLQVLSKEERAAVTEVVKEKSGKDRGVPEGLYPIDEPTGEVSLESLIFGDGVRGLNGAGEEVWIERQALPERIQKAIIKRGEKDTIRFELEQLYVARNAHRFKITKTYKPNELSIRQALRSATKAALDKVIKITNEIKQIRSYLQTKTSDAKMAKLAQLESQRMSLLESQKAVEIMDSMREKGEPVSPLDALRLAKAEIAERANRRVSGEEVDRILMEHEISDPSQRDYYLSTAEALNNIGGDHRKLWNAAREETDRVTFDIIKTLLSKYEEYGDLVKVLDGAFNQRMPREGTREDFWNRVSSAYEALGNRRDRLSNERRNLINAEAITELFELGWTPSLIRSRSIRDRINAARDRRTLQGARNSAKQIKLSNELQKASIEDLAKKVKEGIASPDEQLAFKQKTMSVLYNAINREIGLQKGRAARHGKYYNFLLEEGGQWYEEIWAEGLAASDKIVKSWNPEKKTFEQHTKDELGGLVHNQIVNRLSGGESYVRQSLDADHVTNLVREDLQKSGKWNKAKARTFNMIQYMARENATRDQALEWYNSTAKKKLSMRGFEDAIATARKEIARVLGFTDDAGKPDTTRVRIDKNGIGIDSRESLDLPNNFRMTNHYNRAVVARQKILELDRIKEERDLTKEEYDARRGWVRAFNRAMRDAVRDSGLTRYKVEVGLFGKKARDISMKEMEPLLESMAEDITKDMQPLYTRELTDSELISMAEQATEVVKEVLGERYNPETDAITPERLRENEVELKRFPVALPGLFSHEILGDSFFPGQPRESAQLLDTQLLEAVESANRLKDGDVIDLSDIIPGARGSDMPPSYVLKVLQDPAMREHLLSLRDNKGRTLVDEKMIDDMVKELGDLIVAGEEIFPESLRRVMDNVDAETVEAIVRGEEVLPANADVAEKIHNQDTQLPKKSRLNSLLNRLNDEGGFATVYDPNLGKKTAAAMEVVWSAMKAGLKAPFRGVKAIERRVAKGFLAPHLKMSSIHQSLAVAHLNGARMMRREIVEELANFWAGTTKEFQRDVMLDVVYDRLNQTPDQVPVERRPYVKSVRAYFDNALNVANSMGLEIPRYPDDVIRSLEDIAGRLDKQIEYQESLREGPIEDLKTKRDFTKDMIKMLKSRGYVPQMYNPMDLRLTMKMFGAQLFDKYRDKKGVKKAFDEFREFCYESGIMDPLNDTKASRDDVREGSLDDWLRIEAKTESNRKQKERKGVVRRGEAAGLHRQEDIYANVSSNAEKLRGRRNLTFEDAVEWAIENESPLETSLPVIMATYADYINGKIATAAYFANFKNESMKAFQRWEKNPDGGDLENCYALPDYYFLNKELRAKLDAAPGGHFQGWEKPASKFGGTRFKQFTIPKKGQKLEIPGVETPVAGEWRVHPLFIEHIQNMGWTFGGKSFLRRLESLNRTLKTIKFYQPLIMSINDIAQMFVHGSAGWKRLAATPVDVALAAGRGGKAAVGFAGKILEGKDIASSAKEAVLGSNLIDGKYYSFPGLLSKALIAHVRRDPIVKMAESYGLYNQPYRFTSGMRDDMIRALFKANQTNMVSKAASGFLGQFIDSETVRLVGGTPGLRKVPYLHYLDNLTSGLYKNLQNTTWAMDRVMRTAALMHQIEPMVRGNKDGTVEMLKPVDFKEAINQVNLFMVDYSALPNEKRRWANQVFLTPSYKTQVFRMYKNLAFQPWKHKAPISRVLTAHAAMFTGRWWVRASLAKLGYAWVASMFGNNAANFEDALSEYKDSLFGKMGPEFTFRYQDWYRLVKETEDGKELVITGGSPLFEINKILGRSAIWNFFMYSSPVVQGIMTAARGRTWFGKKIAAGDVTTPDVLMDYVETLGLHLLAPATTLEIARYSKERGMELTSSALVNSILKFLPVSVYKRHNKKLSHIKHISALMNQFDDAVRHEQMKVEPDWDRIRKLNDQRRRAYARVMNDYYRQTHSPFQMGFPNWEYVGEFPITKLIRNLVGHETLEKKEKIVQPKMPVGKISQVIGPR